MPPVPGDRLMQALRSAQLALEPLVAAHAEDMYPLIADPQLYRHLDYPPPPSLDYLRQAYRKLESRCSPDGLEQWLNWVLRAPDGQAAGYVQATLHADGQAWLGYVVGRGFWGRGYATQAARAMMLHLESTAGVACWWASVDRANAPSRAVLDRLGFRPAREDECAAHAPEAHELVYRRDAAPDARHGAADGG